MLHQNSSINQAQNQSNGHSVSIYNKDKSDYTEITSTEESLQQKLQNPFHISVSNLSQNRFGFTDNSKLNTGEKVRYQKITTINEFVSIARYDTTGAKFVDSNRKTVNFLSSDVLVFDIDNDDGDDNVKTKWDDPGQWWTIDQFTKEFIAYEFIIKTSRNHQILKGDRVARPKFHIYMPLGRIIENIDTHQDLLDRMKWYTRRLEGEEYLYRLDSKVKNTHQLYGSDVSSVYYNPGETTINEMLFQDSFQHDYERHLADIGQRAVGQQTEGGTVTGASTGRAKSKTGEWEHSNIIGRYNMNHFYKRIDRKSGNNGYWIAHCDIHGDDNSSLLIFDDLGFKCYGCDRQGNALKYELECRKASGEDELTKGEVVREYCDKHGLDYNEWKQTFLGENAITDDDNFDDDENKDIFDAELKDHVSITTTNNMYVHVISYEILQDMNRNHAIGMISGKTVIMNSFHVKGRGYKDITYQRHDDFIKQYKNQIHKCKSIKIDKTGDPYIFHSSLDIGNIWLTWKYRRQYDDIDFHPEGNRLNYEKTTWDSFDDWSSASSSNKWQGDGRRRGLIQFINQDIVDSIDSEETAVKGCKLFRQHIKHVICGKYEGEIKAKLLKYILYWFSSALTNHTDDRTTVALVLRGGQGVGKGSLANNFGDLFGRYYLHLQDSNRLGDRFNDYMANKLYVFVDEALFAGDSSQIGLLKSMLTERTFMVETKHLPAYVAINYRCFIYASNENWVVPTDADDRRYMVVDVQNKEDVNWRKLNENGREGYFNDLHHEWNNGGKEHFYWYLKNASFFDGVEDFNFEEERPVTSGSVDQLIFSSPLVGWLQRIIENGGHYARRFGKEDVIKWKSKEDNVFASLANGESSQILATKRELYEDYVMYCKDISKTHRGSESWLIRDLNDFCKLKKIEFRSGEKASFEGERTVIVFPGMEKLREQWIAGVYDGQDPFTDGDDLSDIDLDI